MEFRSLTAVTHISHESVPKSRFMTASPSREKPLVEIFTGYEGMNRVGHGTRLLPSGRHPRVASLALRAIHLQLSAIGSSEPMAD